MSGTATQEQEIEWTPEFPSQRPPFEKGNFAALKNGSRSERKVEALARKIDADLLDRAPWVADYPEALAAYARAESLARMLFNDIARNTAYDARGEFRASVIAKAITAENAAMRHREALGLTPRSEAQVARDRAIATAATVDVVGELIQQGRATRTRGEISPPDALRPLLAGELPPRRSTDAPPDIRPDEAPALDSEAVNEPDTRKEA